MLSEGDEVTLLAWGNAVIQSVAHVPLHSQQQPQQQQEQQQQVEQACRAAADADTAVCAQLDQQVQQQQQQHKQKPAASGKPPLAPHTSPLPSPPPAAATAATAAAAAAPAVRLSDAADQGDMSDVEAAAAFWGYKDVFAMRDALQTARKGGWGSSSCASTAGSTSVAALGSLLSDAEEGPQVAAEQSLQAITLSPIKAQQQQHLQSLSQPQQQPIQHQQQQQQQGSPHSNEIPGLSPAIASITAVLNTAGSPKASKLKVHWLPALPDLLLPLRLVRFGHPVLVERVTEEVDVIANFNHNSR
jgi:hypothetical protein